MKASPIIIHWHDQSAPIYSAHFEPVGKGRLATGGGDRHVRLWKLLCDGEDRRVEYICTLSKHTQAVNVVRWAPKGEMLASAGDDGNVILWVQSENHSTPQFGSEGLEDKETWRTKHMCRSSGAEVYDLAWSPDSLYFIIGSMDNIARIYNAATGNIIRQVADHSHYVQGVTWDPLNEFVATQSSDRSVHLYSFKTKDGQHTLMGHDTPTKVASHAKADLPPRRVSSSSPVPPDMSFRSQLSVEPMISMGSPAPSAPGTPTLFALPRNTPSVMSHSRRSSFSSRRSLSPAPSMPLPAVMPIDASPKHHGSSLGSGIKNASLYVNETLTSFFRRLTFTPDGSLLLTPSGQFLSQHHGEKDGKVGHDTTNTVYIYSRGGINKPPIAHLPGHNKPSIAVRCSPIIYTLRQGAGHTKHITIDTSSADESIPSLPEAVSSRPSPANGPSVMEPPPPPFPISASGDSTPGQTKSFSLDTSASSQGPKATFSLNYRMVYAVATQDSILLYDTQQKSPLCIVSNLHCATFTDLAWSSDGLTLLISSSDGYCSTLSFACGDLGQIYTGELVGSKFNVNSNQNTPAPTPTAVFAPPSPFPNGSHHHHRNSASSFAAPSPPMSAPAVRPASPNTRTLSPFPTVPVSLQLSGSPLNNAIAAGTANNPPLISGSIPSITATSPTRSTAESSTETLASIGTSIAATSGGKRDANVERVEESREQKKRRIAPTLVESKES